MNLNDLESIHRAELAELYVAHLGDTTYCADDIEFSPTRAFMAYVQEPCDPGYSFLTDEELLSCLQVTLHGAGVRLPRPERPGGILPPHYTADPAFLAWLEDEKRGWPVLKSFLEYFEPDWYLDYLKELAADAQAMDDADRQIEHASMLGAAGPYGERADEVRALLGDS